MDTEKNKYISRTKKRKQDFQEYVDLLKKTVSIIQGERPNALIINAPLSAISGSLYMTDLRPYMTSSYAIGHTGTSGFGRVGKCGVSGTVGIMGQAGKASWTPKDINAYHSADVETDMLAFGKIIKETAINALDDFFIPIRGGK